MEKLKSSLQCSLEKAQCCFFPMTAPAPSSFPPVEGETSLGILSAPAEIVRALQYSSQEAPTLFEGVPCRFHVVTFSQDCSGKFVREFWKQLEQLDNLCKQKGNPVPKRFIIAPEIICRALMERWESEEVSYYYHDVTADPTLDKSLYLLSSKNPGFKYSIRMAA